MAVEIHSASHAGVLRPCNEDAFVVLPKQSLPPWLGAIAGVFDGVGETGNGSTAASKAARYLERLVTAKWRTKSSPADPSALVADLVYALHAKVRADSQRHPELQGMCTTATVGAVFLGPEPFVVICHVGDSPAFRLRGGILEKLVDEDWLSGQLLSAGLSNQEAVEHPRRHALTQALGYEGQVTPHIKVCTAEPGDRFLLCTDGVTAFLTEDRILDILLSTRTERACWQLVEAANSAGGVDNSTVVIMEIVADP